MFHCTKDKQRWGNLYFGEVDDDTGLSNFAKVRLDGYIRNGHVMNCRVDFMAKSAHCFEAHWSDVIEISSDVSHVIE